MDQPIVIGEIDDRSIDAIPADSAVSEIVDEFATARMLGADIQDLVLRTLGRAPTAPMEEDMLVDLITESES